MNLKQRNEIFKKENLIDSYFLTSTAKLLTEGQRENIALKAIREEFTKSELDLMQASIRKPDEHFYIVKTEDLGEVGFALAAANGQEYVVQSKEETARQKASVAYELKKESASKKWSEYVSTEEYSMRTQLQNMDQKTRKQLEIQAYLIGRVIKGESIMNLKAKEYEEFLEEA